MFGKEFTISMVRIQARKPSLNCCTPPQSEAIIIQALFSWTAKAAFFIGALHRLILEVISRLAILTMTTEESMVGLLFEPTQ